MSQFFKGGVDAAGVMGMVESAFSFASVANAMTC
jgi:hypothetical protein